ncbi:MAG: hypothetical protein ACI9J3_003022 [Parvicellaceae bacterium]|jgi:hypothetical protein
MHGLECWKAPWYKDGASQFSDTLLSNVEYEFAFMPHIMQGGSAIGLKLKFATQELA